MLPPLNQSPRCFLICSRIGFEPIKLLARMIAAPLLRTLFSLAPICSRRLQHPAIPVLILDSTGKGRFSAPTYPQSHRNARLAAYQCHLKIRKLFASKETPLAHLSFPPPHFFSGAGLVLIYDTYTTYTTVKKKLQPSLRKKEKKATTIVFPLPFPFIPIPL